MYVFQFMDATYRIARTTNSTVPFGAIIRNEEASKLYDGAYETRAEADAGMKRINEILAAL